MKKDTATERVVVQFDPLHAIDVDADVIVPVSKKRPSLDSYVDRCDAVMREKIDMAVGRFVYETGIYIHIMLTIQGVPFALLIRLRFWISLGF
jgi:hypothetical protein